MKRDALLRNLTPKALEALDLFLDCVMRGFTGRLVMDFKQGIPLAWETISGGRFGKKLDTSNNGD